MQHDSTVDAYEVDYYTALAETWWDDEGPFWPLHTLNALRVDWIRDKLCERLGRDASSDAPLSGIEILDVGCGGGILSESMARLGARVTGIDVVEKNIGIARAHARESGVDVSYKQQPASALAAEGATFDVVLNMEVVEHVADLDAFMSDCCSLVRPGGTMFVSTINRNPLAWLVAIVGAEYVLRWLPRGTHRYKMLRKPGEIVSRLEQGGLEMDEITGVKVNPFTRSMKLTSLTAINYMLMAQRD